MSKTTGSAISRYIADLLLNNEDSVRSGKDFQRRITASLLMTKYSLLPYELTNNHVSIVVCLVILVAHICHIGEAHKLDSKYWEPSIALCRHLVLDELDGLKKETLGRSGRFLEGNPLGDGDIIYKARTTIILGWLSAGELMMLERDKGHNIDQRVLEIIRSSFPNTVYYWGESASIHFFMMAFLCYAAGEKIIADEIVSSVLEDLVTSNNQRNKSKQAIPCPYYSVDQVLSSEYNLSDYDLDYSSFVGSAYTLEAWIDCAARANLRGLLERLWYSIT